MVLKGTLVQEIVSFGGKYAIEKIVLFGSRARGDNKERSDIDLAIFLGPGFSQEGLIASEVAELDTLLKIDLIFVKPEMDSDLLQNIKREGVVLYERSFE